LGTLQKYYKKSSRNPIKIRQNQSKTIRKVPFFAVSTTFALPLPKGHETPHSKNNIKIMICCAAHDGIGH